jgi:uroporphyrinogen decarboxylase
MHARVEKLPAPAPDSRRFLHAVRCEAPDRVPLIELAVHPAVVAALLDEPVGDAADACEGIRRAVRLHHRLGYDVVKVSALIPWQVERLRAGDDSALGPGERQWVDQHAGPIQTLQDVERYPWPSVDDVDFSPLAAAAEEMADGMALVGFAGGVMEFAMDLLGMQHFLLATRREPALVSAVIDRVGQLIHDVFARYCRMDAVCAVWLGDDLGHKHGLLVSPKVVEEHLLPWYRRLASLAHRHGRPMLLHTCGDTSRIMPALVEHVGIDAKHSFEDGIEPAEAFMDRWGGQVATLGGVDVHLLSTADEAAIRRRTLQILEHAAERGGYACGSGNSITDYVPPAHYLAMIEAVTEFNQAGGR